MGVLMIRKKLTQLVFMCFLCQALLTACSSDNVKKTDISEGNVQIEEVLQKKLDVNSAEEAVARAEIALRNRNTELAQVYFIKAYEMEPENVQILQKMADLYIRLQNYDLAEVSLNLILKQNPNDLRAIEEYGLMLISQRNYKKAKEKLKRVIAKQQSWRAYNGLGIIANVEGEPFEAINYFKKADSLNPNSAELLTNIGFAYYSDNKLEEAENYYIRALQINGEYEKALYNFGLLQARQRNYEEAYKAFAKVTSTPEANNNVGYIAMKNGDYAMASKYLKEAIATAPQYYKKANDNLNELELLEKTN
jgi:tetratricopeptide (TPR) repeat protein